MFALGFAKSPSLHDRREQTNEIFFSVLYLPSAFPAYFLSPGTITSLVSIIGQSHVQNATHPSLTILYLTIDSSTRRCVLLLLNQLLLVPMMFI